MPILNKGQFSRLPTIVPTDSVALAFHELSWPLIERIVAATNESQTLTEIRDLLLPKLISGELRVPEAEKLAGGVL